MSLTLRDAQHLCWKTFKKLEMINSKGSAAFETATYLKSKSQEIGEKISENLITSNSQKKERIARLLSELLFSAFVIAEKEGVSIEEAFLQNVDEMILNSIQ